jgi:DNA polymerase-1
MKPSTDWSAIRAAYLETRSPKAVAEKFGISVNSVRTRCRREGWGEGAGVQTTAAEPSPEPPEVQIPPAEPSDEPRVEPSGVQDSTNEPSSTDLGVQDEPPPEPSEVQNAENEPSSAQTPSIPPNINDLTMAEAARFYHGTLGWGIHALYPCNRGGDDVRGKAPVAKRWRSHTAAQVESDYIQRHFGDNYTHNLGAIIRPPFVHIDLDSKPDQGSSVREWLATQPALAGVPRELTDGGVHLVLRCPDLPPEVLKRRKPLESQLTPKVSCEICTNGMNIVLSPSIHKKGHRYRWDVTGEIPEWPWQQIAQAFGADQPKQEKPGRPKKEKPWWFNWREDLRTLDAVKLASEVGILGDCLDPDEAKWAVRCPWQSEHSGDARGPGSDSVIFNKPKQLPAFNCLHAHCSERTMGHLLDWAEAQKPGIVASHTKQLRVWEDGSTNSEGRQRVLLPCAGRAHSEFTSELGKLVAPALDLFRFARNVVEIAVIPAATAEGSLPGNMLSTVKAAGLVTAAERTVETGITVKDEFGDIEFLPKSMSEQDARITLLSDQFLSPLPGIDRVLDVPVPVLAHGKLAYPKAGYDERFGTWLSPSAPEIRTMGLDEALDLLLGELFTTPEQGGFWWHDEQARTHALARFITPMCRGLMRWRRPPLFIFDGNREGCGKDTCADVTHVVYTGRSVICAPLSKDCDDEMRKRITSALMAAARFFHLANMKGHVRYASLEAATDDSGVWEDRRLGVSETLHLPNETEFSFSANNATWEPDIERRCRRIRLRFCPDNVNGHRYRHSDLRGWLVRHRPDLLSAVAALIAHWVRNGCPAGPSPFTSFPEWGRVVGGVMHTCGLPDPCLPHEDSQSSGDQNTRAMRQFFALALEHFGDREVPKEEFQQFLQNDGDVHDLFDWIDFDARRGLISFGKLFIKFDGRELGGIHLRIRPTSRNRATYQFSRPGGGGTSPDDSTSPPSTAQGFPTPAEKRGCGDVGGCFYHADIARGKIEKSRSEKNGYLSQPYRGVGETSPNIPTSPKPLFHTTAKSLEAVSADLAAADLVALDIETYGERKSDALDPWRGDIRLLVLHAPGKPVHLLDLRAIGYHLGPLADLLSAKPVIGHNIKFDALWLLVKCGLRLPRVFCTLTAARLLAAGTKPGNNLDQCLERYLGFPPAPDHSTSDWGAMLLTDDQIAYAARDATHLHQLKGALDHELEIAGLNGVANLEMRLLPAVVAMEHTGMAVDAEKLRFIESVARANAEAAAKDVRAVLDLPNLNLGSPKQLLPALTARGIPLASTNEESLQSCGDSEVVPKILAHRSFEKQAQQAASLLESLAPDGRIHGRFDPTGTATGRFSSKSPNLQNIGRGELRSCFIAPEGRRLVVADYSQVELRVAAALAGETRMIEAYKRGEDLHRLTASVVLGKPLEAVTKDDRQLAKAVNFGLLYGQNAKGLVRYAKTSYGVELSEDQARAIRQKFFATYGHLRQWHGLSHQQAERGVEEVRTITGRRRLIPSTASAWECFTALVNTPVQGGSADGIKQALVDLAAKLPEGARIISTVHDEIIVECDEAQAESIRDVLASAMREAMAALFPQVPIEAEAGVCRNWAGKS